VQERKTSERAIAFSLSTLGLIYIDSESFGLAEQVLKEAIETSIHAKDTRNIAMGKVRLGRVYLAREELEQAKLLFEEAEKLSMDVNPEVLIARLNRQGRIYLRQGYWKEALPLFERALEVANHIHDHYQQVESLIDYATALEHLNQKDEAQQMWQKVQDIATQENYLTLAFLSLSDNLYWIKRELDFYHFLVRSI
jgi:tetratricopeptide (TPR) repeat protein